MKTLPSFLNFPAFLSIAFCLLLFSSCLTVKQIERNCDKFAKVCTTTSQTITTTRDTTIYKTDTLFFNLPADTVKIVETVHIVNDQAQIKPVNKKMGFIGVNAFIKNNSLNINAWLTDSTILIPHRDTIFLNDAISTTTATTTVTIEKKYIPKFYKFTFWLVIIQAIAAAFFITGYFLRFKFKQLRFLK